MRDIKLDFRRGGGSAPEILFGTATIYGTEPTQNGSGWVVTDETTLQLVNGQATYTNALERPTDGSKGMYHLIVRREHGGAWSFRKYLPAGAGAINLKDMPEAW